MAEDSLERIAAEVRACRKCPLWETRTQGVPGEGPADAEVMIIGEAPGFHEDKQGRPFVGASGRLLDELLATAGLSRDRVFITNVIKSRPPENREPKPNELAACRDYLDRQIALILPKVIVTLGRFSMARYFPGESITRIHGQARRVGDVFYLPLFHPAAALRRDDWREALRTDFAQIPALLEQARTPRADRKRTSGENPDQMSLL